MNRIKLLSAAAFASALTLPAVASADQIWHSVSNEAGVEFRPDHAKSTKSRAEQQRESALARDFSRGRVSPDGWRYVGGERGWVFEGHRIEYRDGKWVHVDGLNHDSKRASPALTPAEKKRLNELYPGV